MDNPLGEKRIKDPTGARALWGKFRAGSETRRRKWAQVQNQLDGAPPFADAELVKFGQGWRCNLNFRDASSALEQVLVSYWRLLHDTPNLVAASVHGNDPHNEKWAQLFQENFNRFIDDWGADYVRNFLLHAQNFVGFGVGLNTYANRWTPRWEVIRQGEVEVPKKAKASIEKIHLLMVRQEMEIDELWDLIRMPSKVRAAEALGWNSQAIREVLTRHVCAKSSNTSIGPDDVMEMQRALRNNSLGVSAGHDPVNVVNAYVREYDGKISRYIFTEKDDALNIFLFDDSSKENRPTEMTRVIGAIFFDAGNGDFWGTKGFGVKNYGLSTVMNRLKSRAVDRTLLDGLNFRDLSEGGREVVPITNIGPFNFLPKDVEQIPSYPTGRSVLETIEMLEGQSAYINARYRDQSQQIARTDTATQANILANIQSQVDVANATLFLKQWAVVIFKEQFRRLRLRGSPDPDAQAFKRRCVDEGGMPEDVFHDAEVTVRTGADPGAANLAVQGQEALTLMTLPSANRRWAQERFVVAKFGAQAVKHALLPEDADAETRSVRLALIENSEMGQGNPMPVDAQDNHAAHLPAHLRPLSAIVDAYDETGRINPDAIVALQMAIPHVEEHFKYLKADKLQQELYHELWPQFTAIQSSARSIMRQIQRMHNEAAAAGFAPGSPTQGFSPSGAVGAVAAQ